MGFESKTNLMTLGCAVTIIQMGVGVGWWWSGMGFYDCMQSQCVTMATSINYALFDMLLIF